MTDASNFDSDGGLDSDGLPDLPDLVDRYQGPLLAYAQRMLGDTHAAQDAVQETFLKLCRHLCGPTKADLRDRVAPWLFTVCRSRVIDMQRKHQPDRVEAIDEVAVMSGESPQAVLEHQEDQAELADQIGRLSPRQQEVLQLRMQAGLSYREIADVTGLQPSNVGFHLHAAVKALRAHLAPETA